MKIKRYNVQGAWINEPFYEIGSVDMVIYKDHLAEVERLKALLWEYRYPKNLKDEHTACYNGPSDARGALGCGWDDDRCDLCKRTDKEFEQ